MLRELGNDAAHLKCKVFSDIGPEECQISLLYMQTLLAVAYQHVEMVSLLEAKKKHPPETAQQLADE